MKRVLLILIACCMLAILTCSVSALPETNNYDCSDTTPTAYDAQVDQSSMGYNSSSATNVFALTAYNRFKSDAIFFFNGHGLFYDYSHKGGGIKFSDESWIMAKDIGYHPGNYPYYITDYGKTDIDDVLLVVYLACYSAHYNPYNGHLVQETMDKGVDICIGFDDEVEIENGKYWSEGFWDRVRNGESVSEAARNAKNECYSHWPFGYHGVDTYEISGDYNGCLTPARYGDY
ncbi:hypothetical protein [Methanogenium sp. MK-MG]|uniref:hypothetical protein n=1 Tax=Methanogenium sp. MK-MG TaxID=2599926 RepID=UPI0013EAD2DD|nr:hypothetical protein [Methanogenium sp. MK-MG]KAF1076151.1 hypothetical protein MKMG_01554 [Methanogenium sp. MK-MG]